MRFKVVENKPSNPYNRRVSGSRILEHNDVKLANHDIKESSFNKMIPGIFAVIRDYLGIPDEEDVYITDSKGQCILGEFFEGNNMNEHKYK